MYLYFVQACTPADPTRFKLNYMAYDRASSDEYDGKQNSDIHLPETERVSGVFYETVWSQFGGSNWDWNSLYPYMKKVENFHAPTVNTPFHDPRTIDTKYEGVGGPVQVCLPHTRLASFLTLINRAGVFQRLVL